ncbi:MAG TPA: response regulator [Gaiellaceae bacterium]|nr:response regulator [Gaiellaceae bacterium]
MTAVQRIRSRRSQPLPASRAHRPAHLAHGTWRSRVRHRPEPGGGSSGGKAPETPAPVLLVDDEPSIRAICRVNLEGDGLRVREAKDGAEALEEVRRQRPSLVLLDVMMPGVDGWGVAEQLATDAATRDIPVVFLSARAAFEDRLRAQQLGAVGYVVKPFDPIGLAQVVRDVLERIARGEREQLNRELSSEG